MAGTNANRGNRRYFKNNSYRSRNSEFGERSGYWRDRKTSGGNNNSWPNNNQNWNHNTSNTNNNEFLNNSGQGNNNNQYGNNFQNDFEDNKFVKFTEPGEKKTDAVKHGGKKEYNTGNVHRHNNRAKRQYNANRWPRESKPNARHSHDPSINTTNENVSSEFPKDQINNNDATDSRHTENTSVVRTNESNISETPDNQKLSLETIGNIKKEKHVDKTSLAVKQISAISKENKASSSDSSSSSSDDESEKKDAKSKKELEKTPKESDKKQKPAKTSTPSKKTKKLKEEDVVCLGKFERKYSIEDDEEADSGSENESASSTSDDEGSSSEDERVDPKGDNGPKTLTESKNAVKAVYHCMICDQKGHTSFQCQMICRNCSAPYHNLRTCSSPPNLAVLMETFMEFCLLQFRHYNPNLTFPFQSKAADGRTNEMLTFPNVISTSEASKKATKSMNISQPKKSKDKTKKRKVTENLKESLKKKKRRVETSESESSEDTTEDAENAFEKDSSVSESSGSNSESSTETKKPAKISKKKQRQEKKHSNSKNPLNVGLSSPFAIPGLPAFYPNQSDANNLPLNSILLNQIFQKSFGNMP